MIKLTKPVARKERQPPGGGENSEQPLGASSRAHPLPKSAQHYSFTKYREKIQIFDIVDVSLRRLSASMGHETILCGHHTSNWRQRLEINDYCGPQYSNRDRYTICLVSHTAEIRRDNMKCNARKCPYADTQTPIPSYHNNRVAITAITSPVTALGTKLEP